MLTANFGPGPDCRVDESRVERERIYLGIIRTIACPEDVDAEPGLMCSHLVAAEKLHGNASSSLFFYESGHECQLSLCLDDDYASIGAELDFSVEFVSQRGVHRTGFHCHPHRQTWTLRLEKDGFIARA